MKYLYSNLIGSFVLDHTGNIIDSILIENADTVLSSEKGSVTLQKKYPQAKLLPPEKQRQGLTAVRDQRYFTAFHHHNLILTKKSLKESVNEDAFIIQTISNVAELDRSCNLLSKRLREWYELYFPELSHAIPDHQHFVELVARKSKKESAKEFQLSLSQSMGADLAPLHVQEITKLAQELVHLYSLRQQHEEYLSVVMKLYCPNLLELAGVTIGAKLLELGKGLKHLALLPASTIQLLGAEKALFRHLKTGAKSPKYGIIINHPLIQNAGKDQKGKAARMLADKLSFCARLDYFKGEFKAPQYRKQLEQGLRT